MNASTPDPLEAAIRQLLQEYFRHLDGAKASALHAMVIERVERTLFDIVLVHTRGNISHAAEMLGIGRNTLRRKLKDYQLISERS